MVWKMHLDFHKGNVIPARVGQCFDGTYWTEARVRRLVSRWMRNSSSADLWIDTHTPPTPCSRPSVPRQTISLNLNIPLKNTIKNISFKNQILCDQVIKNFNSRITKAKNNVFWHVLLKRKKTNLGVSSESEKKRNPFSKIKIKYF